MSRKQGVGLAASGWAEWAREVIPETHRGLPMLRVYLPFHDPARAVGDDLVRWSQYVPVEELSASLDWLEVAGQAALTDPSVRDLDSCMGELDQATAAALRDAIGTVRLRCLRWTGYAAETPPTDSPTRVFDEDYFEADLGPDDIEPGRRVPEFAWDADGRLAWGGRLYPDSLIVAAEAPIFRQLRNDPRLDSAPVRPDRDLLPPSAGD
jgi:hypothetical protein